MTAQSVDAGSQTTIMLKGDLDLSTIDTLTSAIDVAERSHAQRIVLDLSDVEFIDASGLRALVFASERSRVDGNRLRIRKGQARAVSRMFELTAIDEQLPLVA